MITAYALGLLTQTVLLPLLVTVLGLALLRRLLQRQSQPPRFISGIALTAGFLLGYGLIYTQFSFLAHQALDWLPILTIAALLLFALGDYNEFPHRWRTMAQATLVFLAAALLLAPLLRQTGWAQAAVTLLAVGTLWMGAWFYLDRIAQHSMVVGMVLLAIAAGNAVVTALTGSVMLGQLSGTLAAVLGGWLLLNWPRVRVPLGQAGTAVAVMVLGSLMLIGRFYADTSTTTALLLLASLVSGAFALFFIDRNRHAPLSTISTVWVGMAVLVPVIPAVGLAVYVYLGPSGE